MYMYIGTCISIPVHTWVREHTDVCGDSVSVVHLLFQCIMGVLVLLPIERYTTSTSTVARAQSAAVGDEEVTTSSKGEHI